MPGRAGDLLAGAKPSPEEHLAGLDGPGNLGDLLADLVNRASDLIAARRRLGNPYASEQDLVPFTQEDQDIVVALAAAAGVAVQNARLFGEAQRRQLWLAATAKIAAALAWGTDESEALTLVTHEAVACSGALRGALLLSEEGNRAEGCALLVAVRTSGFDHSESDQRVQPKAGGVIDITVMSGQPLQVSDEKRLPGWLAPPPGGTTLLVPLSGVSGLTLGVLALCYDTPSVPDADAGLVATFAAQAAVALALGRARRDHERLAVLEERERIAQDLHDLVIQRLFATGLGLQGLAGTLGSPETPARLDRAVDGIDASIRDLRRAIFSLRSDMNKQGLRSAINEEIRTASTALGFEPELRLSGALDLAVLPDTGADVLAVIREALANVARHAEAGRAVVTVSIVSGLVCVKVDDDGIGFRPGAQQSGIANMRARAERRGGSCQLGPGSPGGTCLTWQVPLAESTNGTAA